MDSLKLEDSYRVLELEKYGEKLNFSTRQHRELDPNEILVKVMCATLNPADNYMLWGAYGIKPALPMVPGLEGSGLIVDVGKDCNRDLIGKKCAVSAGNGKHGFYGVWSQYVYTTIQGVLVFNGEIDYETICFAQVNPLTACGFLDTVRKRGGSAAGQSGGNTAVGKMFIRLCKKEGIKTVSVVRKADQIEALKEIGADFVLNSSDPNFERDLKATLEENNVRDFFDCVGGDITLKCFTALPANSVLYHYGNMENKPIGTIGTSDLVFMRKELKGFWLSSWTKTTPLADVLSWIGYVAKDLLSGSDIFKATVSKNVAFEDFQEAFDFYNKNSSLGKIVIRPNEN